MLPARINALLEPFLNVGASLSPTQLDQISTYLDLLQRWNARINLTAIRKEEGIIPRHFGESFFLARHLFSNAKSGNLLSSQQMESQPIASTVSSIPSDSSLDARGSKLVAQSSKLEAQSSQLEAQSSQLVARSSKLVTDLGSGAGFPGLPLKIYAPEIHLTLIESNHKKAAFLREVVRALALSNVNVIAARAEALISCREATQPSESKGSALTSPAVPLADVVTFRAVENFARILPVAARLLSPVGRLALLIGAAQQSELHSLPAYQWQAHKLPNSQSRLLVIGQVGNTPNKRRPGIYDLKSI